MQKLISIEQTIELHPDTAYRLLEEIPIESLKKEECKALYHLLNVEAHYKLNKEIPDLLQIDYSIAYYEREKDNLRLATAYYYKGVTIYKRGQKEQATLCLKKAEELAKHTEDELLRNKLYEVLSYINTRSHDNKQSLYYTKLFLQSSIVLGDTLLICRAYDNMAVDYKRLGFEDSVFYYREKSRNLLDKYHIRNSYHLANYASDLIVKGNYAKAKDYLQQAIEIKPHANEFLMLGKIAYAEKDTMRARAYWEKAIAFNEVRHMVTSYQLLAKLYFERSEHEQAYVMLDKADSIKEAYYEQLRTKELAEIQHKYDKAVSEREAAERLNRWLMVLIATITLLAIVIIYHVYRVRRFKGIISQNVHIIKEAEQKILFLQSTGKDFKAEIEQLHQLIARLKEETTARLGKGKDIYEQIKSGQRLVGFSSSDEQAFIDYYAFLHNDRFEQLLEPYQSPTRRLVTYLILREMELDDKVIQQVLSISASTIRSYRHRMVLKKY